MQKPGLFALSKMDKPATSDDLEQVEKALGLRLPTSYRDFLSEFGGGDTGLLTVFSADKASSWYLPTRHAQVKRYLPEGLLAISDDGAGGFCVLRNSGVQFGEAVCYWNLDGEQTEAVFPSVLDFVARYAYGPA